jgi:MSHA biogenesis protein MshJ
MKKQWQLLARRIDAMQLRERVFLFLAIIIAGLALADTVWLTPAQLAHTQTTQRLAAQEIDIQRLRDELKMVAQPIDASKTVRDDIAAANLQLDAVNADIRAVAPQAVGGPDIEQALVQFLQRQEGLTLLSTGTIKQDATNVPSASAAVTADAASVLSRRGLELTVSGSYPALTRYVRTLENALPTLRWSTLQLKATTTASEMTLQVYVVGVTP